MTHKLTALPPLGGELDEMVEKASRHRSVVRVKHEGLCGLHFKENLEKDFQLASKKSCRMRKTTLRRS